MSLPDRKMIIFSRIVMLRHFWGCWGVTGEVTETFNKMTIS